MPQLTIVAHGDSAAVILPAKVLESAGLRVGDVLEVTSGEGELILRSADDAVRRKLMETITQELFERRKDAYQRLA